VELTVSDTDKTLKGEILIWLRGVLSNIVEVSPLSAETKGAMIRFIRRLPDWVINVWATALNVDYVTIYRAYPDLAQKVMSATGRKTVQRYFVDRNVVSLVKAVHQLVQRVVRYSRIDRLPIGGDVVVRGVCALALACSTREGAEFVEKAKDILDSGEPMNHIIIDYQLALDAGRADKLETINTMLLGNRYGEWVDCRLEEAKRCLGLEPPQFHIHYGQRTPQWDSLWSNMNQGGEDD
jgi:hypothetical protein